MRRVKDKKRPPIVSEVPYFKLFNVCYLPYCEEYVHIRSQHRSEGDSWSRFNNLLSSSHRSVTRPSAENSTRLTTSPTKEMAARSRITVLLLLFLLSTEHSFAVNLNELEPLVDELLSKYRAEGVFSLAVSIPLNQNQNQDQTKNQNQGAYQIQKVLESDPAANVENKINNGEVLSDKPRSELIKSSNLRLDNQGLVNRNNQRCYNLQIQINGPRGPGCSTTVAQIIVPVDTSAEYMRLAFRESLKDRLGVVVEVNEASTSTNNNQKSCKRRKN
ncbi:unnamed protein product [Pleuronectes platessa]|uniref:Uncharacterized protein n=1 Tax=Pleuronectes platessa TaxID=8262 RepID=A0A9N7TII3_PLEPL|nr:unnamed protein product [Pleuronectes platessa]